MRCHLCRVVVAVALVVLGMCVFAPTASADACQAGPTPESPRDGFAGYMLPERNGVDTGAQATQFEQYGFAGLDWESYDVGVDVPVAGCIPNADAINASVTDNIANLIFGFAIGTASFADSILHSAFDSSWTQVLDPFVAQSVLSLRVHVFDVFVPFAISVLGFIILLRARRSNLAANAALIGGGLLVMVTAAAVFSYPLWVAHGVDYGTTQGVQIASSAINGDSSGLGDTHAPVRTADQALMNSIYDNVLWRAWLAGEFGDPTGPTARKYGRDLFAAQALTWDEAAQQAAAAGKTCVTPDNPAEITAGGQKVPCSALAIKTKRDRFVSVAAKIQAEDPVAYDNIQGNNGRDRIWYAVLAFLSVALSLPVIVMAALAMVSCILVARFAVILMPILFPAAVIKPSLGMGVWDRIASIAVSALVWGIGVPIVMTLDAAVFQAQLAPAVQLLLLFGIALMSFVTLWGFAPGFSGLVKKRHAKKGYGFGRAMLGKLAGASITGLVAGKVAANVIDNGDAGDPDGTYSHTYGSVGRRSQSDPGPSALPAAGLHGEPVDAHVIPDGVADDDDIIDVDEVVPGRELPSAVYEPSQVSTAADLDERALPDEPDPSEIGREGDGATVAPVRDDGGDVYEIYSGSPDWIEPSDVEAEDTFLGEVGDTPALPSGDGAE